MTIGALGHRFADLEHLALEALAVFGEPDRLDRRAEQLDAVALEHAGFVELDREVEAGLPAQRRQQRVRALARDDRFDRCDGQRLEIDRVGHLGIGHDRRRIRVDEDDAVAFFAQRAARLNAGVVELGGLTDDDRSRPDDHHVPAGHARAVSLGGAPEVPGEAPQGCRRRFCQVGSDAV